MPLTNEQYESIMKKYDATRTRNRHLLEERRLPGLSLCSGISKTGGRKRQAVRSLCQKAFGRRRGSPSTFT